MILLYRFLEPQYIFLKNLTCLFTAFSLEIFSMLFFLNKIISIVFRMLDGIIGTGIILMEQALEYKQSDPVASLGR